MKQKNIWTVILTYGLVISVLIGICYYFIGEKSLKMISYTEEYSGTETTQITPNLVNNVSVVQKFITHADFIDGLVLRFATFNNTLRDGNIVTANGFSALEFTREILYALGADTPKKIEKSYRMNKTGVWEAPEIE